MLRFCFESTWFKPLEFQMTLRFILQYEYVSLKNINPQSLLVDYLAKWYFEMGNSLECCVMTIIGMF